MDKIRVGYSCHSKLVSLELPGLLIEWQVRRVGQCLHATGSGIAGAVNVDVPIDRTRGMTS